MLKFLTGLVAGVAVTLYATALWLHNHQPQTNLFKHMGYYDV